MQKIFIDTNEVIIPYSGQEITWRISAYAIIAKGNKVLLKREGDDLFDFPGGGIEAKESMQEGLEREALEEIGSPVHVGNYITHLDGWFYHRVVKKFHHTLRFYFEATLTGKLGVPTDTRIQEVKWFDWNAIHGAKFQDDVRAMKDLLQKK